MNELKVFNYEQNEIRTVAIKNEPWLVGKDVAEALGYSNPQKAIRDHVDDEDKTMNESFTVNGTQGILINESGLYSLIMSSQLPNAKQFKRWVTSEVLPSIRKNGIYATEVTIDNMINNPDFAISLLTKLKEEQQAKRELEISLKETQTELCHKEDVIIGFVEGVDLTTKRQRLDQIMKYKFKDAISQSKRWNLLYTEFERKYHINLKVRMERDNETAKPKYKSKLDYIDRKMNMIPQAYELACKIFENDVEKLKAEWFDTVNY